MPEILLAALAGNMLGDGYLGFTKKDASGKPKPNTNAHYSMTLKSYDYVMFLWSKIYYPICTSTIPAAWPNPKTGLPASQYHFSTRTLSQLTLLHSMWYVWSDDLCKFIKIVPLNIAEIFTPLTLALWIMDDGFKHGNGVGLCTECYTLLEVQLLMRILTDKFGLAVTCNPRKLSNNQIGWRISISGKPENRKLLHSLVLPHFIPTMVYKLGL